MVWKQKRYSFLTTVQLSPNFRKISAVIGQRSLVSVLRYIGRLSPYAITIQQLAYYQNHL